MSPWDQQLAEVLLIAGANGIAARQTAAAIYDLDGFERGSVPIQVDIPRTEHSRDPRISRRTQPSPIPAPKVTFR